jgi:GT2 family glycosyltransferase
MTIVVIPTYNEIDNLAPIVAGVHAAVPGADVLVVDDASPDGTGALADRLAADDPRVHVLHRAAKQGLGAAYRARGTSKMSRAIVAEALLRTTRWALGHGPQLPAPLSGRLR